MKAIIINALKKYHWLYSMYYYVASYTLRFLGSFIRASQKEFLIVCYGGQKYGDNMRPVYEALLQDQRFFHWRFVWAFRDTDSTSLPDSDRTIKCKIDTPTFFYHALRAKCWLTNVSVQRGLSFKNKGTLYVNTWHGVPLKHIGLDIKEGSSFKVIGGVEDFDLICTMGKYDYAIAKSAFGVGDKKIEITGYPRNDIMFKENIEKVRERVKRSLNVDFSKKLVLYAPTYRDYNIDKLGSFYFEKTLSTEKFKDVLGEDYTLVVRAHGSIASSDLDGYIDATNYPDVEDLLRVIDILVTDYSGIMFDYSLLEKPTVCYAYDLEKYIEKRGLYIDYNSFIPFPICQTEDELYNIIKKLDYGIGSEKARQFVNKCGLVQRDAAQNVINAIYEHLYY